MNKFVHYEIMTVYIRFYHKNFFVDYGHYIILICLYVHLFDYRNKLLTSNYLHIDTHKNTRKTYTKNTHNLLVEKTTNLLYYWLTRKTIDLILSN